MLNLKKIIGYPVILIVKIYQYLISPIFPPTCRFNPTCSNYMIEAIEKRGLITGLYFGLKRILSCHPWGRHGHDPVPPKK